MPARTKVYVPLLAGYVGEKLNIDLLSMSIQLEETDICSGWKIVLVDTVYPIPKKKHTLWQRC